MTRTYKVLILQPEGETVRDYEATSYAEAFTMAERSMAGVADALYGIPADGYGLARSEGVAFNEADGLLVDDSWTVAALVRRMKAEIVRDMECGRVPLTVTGVADLHDHVDANEYGGLTKDDCPLSPYDEAATAIINAAQAEVDAWLADRASRRGVPSVD